MIKQNNNTIYNAYENGIINKAYEGGKVVYQRVIPPQYRFVSGETYCDGYDKMVDVESQITYDEGQTWVTTATTVAVVEKNSEDCGHINYNKKYLTFTATQDGTFKFSSTSYYSLDSGATWTRLNMNTNTPTILTGDKIMWKSTNEETGPATSGCGIFSSSARFTVEGNVMSMAYGDNFIGQNSLSVHQFQHLFSGCTNLTSIENLKLPSTTMTSYCYHNMFRGCVRLTNVPSDLLPAQTLAEGCYGQMFYGCVNLTTAPVLPAKRLTKQCYNSMFASTKINKMECYALSFGNDNIPTLIWLYDVPSTGLFIKPASMTKWTRSSSGIPKGWTIRNI